MEEKSKDPRLAALEALAAFDEEIDFHWPADQEILGYRLVCTCGACPEQYDVFNKDGDKVGYLRLRHGHFRADFPDCGGETVYKSDTKGDGSFAEDERLSELTKAITALQARAARGA